MRSRAPFRPNNEITQAFNDGTVDIYAVTDTAKPGYQPKKDTTHKFKLRFAEQRLGINRLYLSRQQHTEILKVIRVQRADVLPGDAAVLHDSSQYTVDSVQAVPGVHPPSLDVALKAITHKLEVAVNE